MSAGSLRPGENVRWPWQRPWELLACSGVQLLGYASLSWPLARQAGAFVAGHPRGEGVLFEPGSLWLLEFLAQVPAELGGQGWAMGLFVLGFPFVELVPWASLVRALGGRSQRGLKGWLRGGSSSFGTLALLLLLALALQGVLVLLALASTRGLVALTAVGLPWEDGLWAGGTLALVLVSSLARCWFDLARVRILDEGAGVSDALAAAWGCMSFRMYGAYSLRGALGMGALVAGGALASQRAESSGLAFLLLGLLLATWLRADWLALALRNARCQPPRPERWE